MNYNYFIFIFQAHNIQLPRMTIQTPTCRMFYGHSGIVVVLILSIRCNLLLELYCTDGSRPRTYRYIYKGLFNSRNMSADHATA